MRAFLLATVALVPVVANAEAFQLSLPVVSAEVYPGSARVQAAAQLELPAGQHEIEILLPREVLGFAAPKVAGAALLKTAIGQNTQHDPKRFDGVAQQQGRLVLDAALNAEDAARLALATQERKADGLRAAAEFLGSLRGDSLPEPEALVALVAVMEAELGRNADALAEAEAGLPALENALAEAEEVRARAQAALEALEAPDDDWVLMTLTVEAPEAGPVAVAYEYLDAGAGWSVQYDARLGEVDMVLERSVGLRRGPGLPWIDAAITLSSSQPDGQTEPSRVRRSIAEIFDPEGLIFDEPMAVSPSMLAEEADIALAASPTLRRAAQVNFDGPFVSYSIPDPVTVVGRDSLQFFALGELGFEVDRYLTAAPRFDDYAFVVAEFTNRSGEVLLPGDVRLYQEDVLVGEGRLPLIAQGSVHELGFGPELTVALDVEFLDAQTGDRGIIRGSRTREDIVRVSAENTGDAVQEVYLRYAVPTSQQEDLEIRVEMDPVPTVQEADDLLGVMEWVLELAPGERQEIDLSFDLRWPEGQVLNWRP